MVPRLTAPITPFLAEEIFSHAQKDSKKSVFEEGYPVLQEEWNNPAVEQTWSVLAELKSAVNKELEMIKKQGVIKSGLEVELSIQPGRIGI